jgi:hypothetical protein
MATIKISISIGELCDRISILMVKKANIKDRVKLDNVSRQLEIAEQELISFWSVNDIAKEIRSEIRKGIDVLVGINSHLWKVEDLIRNCEKFSNFGDEFISLAREVYRTNDNRHLAKRKIDDLLGSDLAEEKEYTNYEKDSTVGKHL